MPTEAPTKFAFQVTAKFDGVDKTVFLGKTGDGVAVTDIKQAAACTVTDGNLVCEGKIMGSNPEMGREIFDMGPVEVVKEGGISGGWSIDGEKLRWRNDKEFMTIGGWKAMNTTQNSEAGWGLFQSSIFTDGALKVFAQLGCPGGTHLTKNEKTNVTEPVHEQLWLGQQKNAAL